jgi:secreted trypsin-like serine protease
MVVNKFIRAPLWASLVGALVAAMVVYFFMFVQSGKAAPQAADARPSSASVSPLIVGGTEVPDGEYPFVTFVTLYRNGKPEASCGGSLIDQNSVLTAAHCLLNTTGAVVVIGRTDLKNKNRGQEIGASRCRGPKAQACGKGHQADQARNRKTKQSGDARTQADSRRLGTYGFQEHPT